MNKRSNKLHKQYYSKDKAINYESDRVGPRWNQEQKYVQNILKNYNSNSYSIIDAPIGTNRFCDIFDEQANIDKIYGFDFSQDMLDVSAGKNTSNLFLQKLDLVKQSLPVKCEVSICSRILNLFNEKDVAKILSNILDSTLDICIVSIRTHKDNSLHYRDKLYCHSDDFFSQLIKNQNFTISNEELTPEDRKPGVMRLLTLTKIK